MTETKCEACWDECASEETVELINEYAENWMVFLECLESKCPECLPPARLPTGRRGRRRRKPIYKYYKKG